MIAPYGSWSSPITAELVAEEGGRFGEIQIEHGDVYWVENRPREKGRNALMCYRGGGELEELLPRSFNVRTRVHEYGGGTFTVFRRNVVFVNYPEDALYQLQLPATITNIHQKEKCRYADLFVDEARNRIICIQEDHGISSHEPQNSIVALSFKPETDVSPTTLCSGYDFYSNPRVSPDGKFMSWLAWRHPHMPWDTTELWVGRLDKEGALISSQCIAGGGNESIFQPEWSEDGTLYFLSDRTGWWNFYRWNGQQVKLVLPMEAEFGLPQWMFGMSTYGFLKRDEILCTYTRDGMWYLALLNTKTKQLTTLDSPYTYITQVRAENGMGVFIGSHPEKPLAIVMYDQNNGSFQEIRSISPTRIASGYISHPISVSYPVDNGETQIHGFYYSPVNQDYQAPEGERPPLIVMMHGGPTSAAEARYNLKIQYWTSRGFAVLDVNYRGSTGFGRVYRELLNRRWGIADVEDCVEGARFLSKQGWVDNQRLIIRGSSAGGYTVLAALAFHDVFSAGACYYGIGDLELLVKETHKFESRYLEKLIGPYPEERQTYIQRSPIHAIQQINVPVIFFQGLEDKVVPPDQAENMVKGLKERGIPVVYMTFEEEGHGFRQAETVLKTLLSEWSFYGTIFEIPLPEGVPPIEFF